MKEPRITHADLNQSFCEKLEDQIKEQSIQIAKLQKLAVDDISLALKLHDQITELKTELANTKRNLISNVHSTEEHIKKQTRQIERLQELASNQILSEARSTLEEQVKGLQSAVTNILEREEQRHPEEKNKTPFRQFKDSWYAGGERLDFESPDEKTVWDACAEWFYLQLKAENNISFGELNKIVTEAKQ